MGLKNKIIASVLALAFSITLNGSIANASTKVPQHSKSNVIKVYKMQSNDPGDTDIFG